MLALCGVRFGVGVGIEVGIGLSLGFVSEHFSCMHSLEQIVFVKQDSYCINVVLFNALKVRDLFNMFQCCKVRYTTLHYPPVLYTQSLIRRYNLRWIQLLE